MVYKNVQKQQHADQKFLEPMTTVYYHIRQRKARNPHSRHLAGTKTFLALFLEKLLKWLIIKVVADELSVDQLINKSTICFCHDRLNPLLEWTFSFQFIMDDVFIWSLFCLSFYCEGNDRLHVNTAWCVYMSLRDNLDP